MNPFRVYQEFVAIRLYFNGVYDYPTYRHNVNHTVETFENLPERKFYNKLAGMKDWREFIISANLYKPNPFVVHLFEGEEYLNYHQARMKRKESLTYTVINEVDKKDINQWMKVEKNHHPKILRDFLGKKISLETLTVLTYMTKALPIWQRYLKGDTIFQTVRRKVECYLYFLPFNEEKIRRELMKSYG